MLERAFNRPSPYPVGTFLAVFTRFITAASDGDMDAVKNFLKEGLDVNSPDWDKLTALVAASSQGHLAIVKILLDKASACDASKSHDNSFL